jgi:hypothetical protein
MPSIMVTDDHLPLLRRWVIISISIFRLSPQGLSGHLDQLLVPDLQLAPLLAHHLTAQ